MTPSRPAEPAWFDLTPDQRAILGPLREFLRAEVAPGATERDASGAFPHEIVEQLGAMGVLGMQVPERWGGAALDTATMARIVEEIAAVDGSLCLTVASHNSLCTGHILVAGSAAQKDAWLPDLASGRSLGAWALTEPGSGSDAAGLATRAEASADGFVLQGSKSFVTQGTVGGTYVVVARTDPPAQGRSKANGISAFVFAGDAEGLMRGKPEEKMGLHSSDTSPLTFENLAVPADALLGTRGEAFVDVMEVLSGGRIGIGAMGVGLGRAALERASRYALEREQFGRPIADNQGVSFKIAEMALELEAARLLVLKAAALRDAGREYALAASMAKLKGSVAGVRACDHAIQILGGYGYIRDYEVERLWRDARLTRIGEGTDEIQHLIIARATLEGFRA
jgi:alkylation response protein AidB-like acyl-CoA dehydrogenase